MPSGLTFGDTFGVSEVSGVTSGVGKSLARELDL